MRRSDRRARHDVVCGDIGNHTAGTGKAVISFHWVFALQNGWLFDQPPASALVNIFYLTALIAQTIGVGL